MKRLHQPLHRHGAVALLLLLLLLSTSLDETLNHLRDTPVSLRRGWQILQHSVVVDSGFEVVTQKSRGCKSSVSQYHTEHMVTKYVLTSSEKRDRVRILMRVSRLLPAHFVLSDPSFVLLGESFSRCPAVGDVPHGTRDAEALP
jgi:hypothetical protein